MGLTMAGKTHLRPDLMEQLLKEVLWKQIGASIDMLSNVIDTCPEKYLEENKRFYYIVYHSVVFLDYYLTIPPEDFSPKLSFTLTREEDRPEESLDDVIPDKFYTRKELLDYLKLIRVKAKKLIYDLSGEQIRSLRFTENDAVDRMDFPILEILLYNLRHTQHHVGQLNMIMRQDLNKHSNWISRSTD